MKQVPFRPPEPLDANVVDGLVERMIKKQYSDEAKRLKYTVDDTFREKVQDVRLPAEVDVRYADLSAHDEWRKTYFEKYGGIANPINTNYKCPHCLTSFGVYYPPKICPVCHKLTAFGQMIEDGTLKR